jgi:tetratricopeptide (TPR) repeat protein
MSTSVDVSNSLLLGERLTTPPAPVGHAGRRERSIWPVIGPVVFVLVLLVLATAYSGAFDVDQWGPPTLFILLMLLTFILRGGAASLPDRWVGFALAGAWGLAAWAAASSAWSGSPAAALEGAGRQVMYAAILTLPFVAVGDMRALRVAGRGVVGGIVLIALYTLGWMLIDGPAVFLAGRLNEPIGYRNATALLFCLAYWPLIVFAATRGRGRVLRGASFGLAVLMLGLAFLTQSRGVLLGLGCGALVAMTLGPDRVRRMWLALLSFALLAGASHWLLNPYHAFDGGEGIAHAHNIAVAANALVALVAISTAVGFLLAVFDTGLRPASPAMKSVRTVARLGLTAAVMLLLVGAMVAVHGNPANEARAKWREFRSLQTTSTSATRYTSAGGQRYDLWRVALLELRANPVGGVGEGSYEFGYYRMRRTNRNLNDPHGLLFQIGAELGVVGLLLFALIPLGLFASLRRSWRRAAIDARRSACGLTAVGATFLGQSLVDWMWRIPGVTALGLLCPAIAVALLARSASNNDSSTPGQSANHLDHRPRRRWGRAGAGGVLAVAIVLVLGLYLSDVYIRHASDELGHSTSAQLADARAAESLDPWGVDAHYLEASALETEGRRSAAEAQLQDARRLEPSNPVPLGLLGDFEARGRNFAQARVYYRHALALNPLDVGLQQLARTGGRPAASTLPERSPRS